MQKLNFWQQDEHEIVCVCVLVCWGVFMGTVELLSIEYKLQ